MSITKTAAPVVNCPSCKRKVNLVPHPNKPGRVHAFCVCNPVGAVLETDAPAASAPANKSNKSKEDVADDSTSND